MGQRTCATLPHHQHLVATDLVYRLRRARPAAAPAPPAGVLRIPVVIHVLWRDPDEIPAEAMLRSQIDVLNEDFRARNADLSQVPAAFRARAADCQIEFALARRDPRGLATGGITRTRTPHARFPYDGSAAATGRLDALIKTGAGGVAAWPREHYLNLWVCPLGDGLLGYAQFPGGAAETDGVVVRTSAFGRGEGLSANFALGRTCTHEVGHWLDLLHVWGDDGQGCTGSDRVADTPNQGGPNTGKPAHPRVSCGNGPDGDLFMDYMDYVDDVAMMMFTRDQAARMRATLAGPRASLLSSPALHEPVEPPQPAPASSAASSRRSSASSA